MRAAREDEQLLGAADVGMPQLPAGVGGERHRQLGQDDARRSRCRRRPPRTRASRTAARRRGRQRRPSRAAAAADCGAGSCAPGMRAKAGASAIGRHRGAVGQRAGGGSAAARRPPSPSGPGSPGRRAAAGRSRPPRAGSASARPARWDRRARAAYRWAARCRGRARCPRSDRRACRAGRPSRVPSGSVWIERGVAPVVLGRRVGVEDAQPAAARVEPRVQRVLGAGLADPSVGLIREREEVRHHVVAVLRVLAEALVELAAHAARARWR